MLTLLEPDQVGRYWEDIRNSLQYAVPPLATADDAGLLNIQTALLSRNMQAWVLHDKGVVYAMVVTVPVHEVGTGEKNLLIYSLCGYTAVPDALWREGFESLTKWAKAQQCNRVMAYSSVPRILEIARGLGADLSTTFISWRL